MGDFPHLFLLGVCKDKDLDSPGFVFSGVLWSGGCEFEGFS